MVYQKISFPVKSFDEWKPGFVNHGDARKAHSCQGAKVYTQSGDKSKVVVVMNWSDKGLMEKFGASPDLKEAMQKSGVVGPPEFAVQDVEFDVSALVFQFESDY